MGTKHRDFGTLNGASEGAAGDRTSDLHAPGFIATTDPASTYGTDDASKPPGVKAGQLWIEESSADTFDTLKYRNSSNDGWIEIDLDVSYDDDEKLQFGTDNDYWFVYNSSGTQFELWTTDSDGGGADGLVFDVPDGADVLDFTSTPTVGGTNVVLETRTLTGGNGIDAIGDLSANRTVAISTDGVGTDELDLSIAPTWTGAHTFNAAVNIGTSNGLDVNPGSDADADLVTVGVTGTPRLWWDESDDRFALTHGLDIDAGSFSTAGAATLDTGANGSSFGGRLTIGTDVRVNSTAANAGYRLDTPSDSTSRTVLTHDGTNDYLNIGGGAWARYVFIGTAPIFANFPNTSTGTGLLVATNDGSTQEVFRDSSTLRLKDDIAEISLEDARRFLDVPAIGYRMHGQRDVGFGAEHVHDAGLEDVVSYVDGEPMGFKSFGRGLIGYHHRLIQDHESRIAELEAALN